MPKGLAGGELMKFNGPDELRIKFAEMADPKGLRALVEAAARQLIGKVKKYPSAKRLSRREVYGTTFKTVKQQRWFFAALRDGRLEIPYVRGQNGKSENLGQSWTVEMRDDTTAAWGTQVSYAPLMQDPDRQSMYAKAVGWRDVREVSQEEEPALQEVIERGLKRITGA